MLQAYGQLSKYGVKARLQSLWRDAHSIAPPAHQRQPAPKRKRPQDSSTAAEDALGAPHGDSAASLQADFVTLQQAVVFAVCNSYMDLFLPNHPYPARCAQPSSELLHTHTAVLLPATHLFAAYLCTICFCAYNSPTPYHLTHHIVSMPADSRASAPVQCGEQGDRVRGFGHQWAAWDCLHTKCSCCNDRTTWATQEGVGQGAWGEGSWWKEGWKEVQAFLVLAPPTPSPFHEHAPAYIDGNPFVLTHPRSRS